MIMLNGYSIVEMIDNRKTNNKFDLSSTFINGYSQHSGLCFPNQGRIIESSEYRKGDIVTFFNYDLIQSDIYINNDHVYIKDSSIFLYNDMLVQNKVVVTTQTFEQDTGAFILRNQEFFVVTDIFGGKVNQAMKDKLVIVKAYTSYRFNVSGNEYFLIDPENVMLIISLEGIHPGDSFSLLKANKHKEKNIAYTQLMNGSGYASNKLFHFTRSAARLDIAGEEIFLVKKADIYACG